MLREIVIPNNNEAEFAEIASKLGIKKLIFLYGFDDFNEKLQKRVEELNGYKGIRVEIGLIVNQKNIKKSRKNQGLIVAKSSGKDRFFIESGKVDLMYGFEEISNKDYLHQRASGLNHILCDLLKRNGITVGFSYGSLGKSQETPLLIGRMMQNIMLCQKYRVKTAIASFSGNQYSLRSPHDVISLFSLLGMDTKTAKESLENPI